MRRWRVAIPQGSFRCQPTQGVVTVGPLLRLQNLVQNRCMLSNAPQVEGSQIATSSSTAVDLEEIEQKLGIQEPEDWFTVNLTDAHEMGLSRKSVKSTAQLVALLEEKYPTIKWDKMYVMRGRFGLQRRLKQAVVALFPNQEIIENARKEAGILNPETGHYLELDVFVPALKLSFEYQERHHYLRDTAYSNIPLEETQKRDQLKQELAHENGITLVTVPCWWDNQNDSLAATIRLLRPDLHSVMASVDAAEPISKAPPANFFSKHVTQIEGVGEPINPCFFVNSQTDPTNWWVFEKYDGVRGFWNPQTKTMYARTGRKLVLPENVVYDMPQDLFLDGELWFGRDNFQEAAKIAHRMDSNKVDWKGFKYMVFDIPTSRGNYSERYNQIREAPQLQNRKFISLAPYTLCEGTDHLEKIFQDIMDQGGEGVIIRDPSSPYQAGRSSGFLKHKKYRDAEARIIKNESGVSWECEMPNGVRFVAPAGTTEFAKRFNPQPGDIVTFKHRGYMLSSNKPKVPTLYRIREDLTWENVVQNWKERAVVTPRARPIKVTPVHKHGHWANIENRRKFLLDLANKMDFDPKVAENWRNQRFNILANGGAGLMSRYRGSLTAVIQNTFPELQFEETAKERPALQRKLSHTLEQRRQYLLGFANKMGFDPMIKTNWKRMTSKIIANDGGGYLARYGGSVKALLADSFPELFAKAAEPEGHWDNVANRRQFLLAFAKKKGFNPMIAENWRRTSQRIRAAGGAQLLDKYPNVLELLKDTFPDLIQSIPITEVEPLSSSIGYWADSDNRRQFLDDVAAKLGFDPLVASNWKKTRAYLLNHRGGSLLQRYGGSIKAMLADTYPEMNLVKEPEGYWDDIENRRQFLIKFAENKGFDPTQLSNWRDRAPQIRAQGGLRLIDKYGSVPHMLADTFAMESPENVRTQKLGHWADRENRRQFLLDFAKKMGFEPFIEENWQCLTSRIAANQGAGLLARYHWSIKAALEDTFPEMEWTETGFKWGSEKEKYWDDIENRRQFLLGFAEKSGFDPMIHSNWRNKAPKIRRIQSDILARYGDSLKALLIDTFPEIFGKTKERESYWEDRQNRKRFLTALSSKLGFDPLVIENWHEKTTQLRAYGGAPLLAKYGDVRLMLLDTFPEIKATQRLTA